jgi:hypothetical protein
MALDDLSGVGGSGSSGITEGGGGGAGGATLSEVSDAFNVEFVTLSIADITNKYTVVTNIPAAANKTKLEVIEGQPADLGVDYVVNTALKQVGWSGLALDGILVAGDKLRITYFNV